MPLLFIGLGGLGLGTALGFGVSQGLKKNLNRDCVDGFALPCL
ncbi:hypothetical protein [Vibrio sp. 10N.261.46.C5]